MNIGHHKRRWHTHALVPQPFEATAKAPAKLRRIVPYENIPAVADNVEAKRPLTVRHCYTGYGHN